MLPETGAFELNRRLESLVLSGFNGLSRFSVPLLPEPLPLRVRPKVMPSASEHWV